VRKKDIHKAYIIKSPGGRVYIKIYKKDEMTQEYIEFIKRCKEDGSLLKEKEQLQDENYRQFIARIKAVTKQIAKQLNLEYC